MTQKLRMNQAIVAALEYEMARDDSVIVMGEDVAAAGGPFKTSDGLLARFGPERVMDTPISEAGFLGAAVGAAMAGMRPIAEIMFVEFMGVALDQVVTEAAMMHHLSAGRLRVPMVIRASVGAGAGFGCQHSQTLERWLMGTPGLKLGVVSGPASAYSMMRSAIREDDPVVILEPRALYGRRDNVETDSEDVAACGEPELLRIGTDVTIVALGQMVGVAESAATNSSGWDAEVIDLRWLAPWPHEAVERSVRKTGRLVIVEENQLTGGWGAHVAYHVSSRLHYELRAPVLRVAAPDVHVPYARSLEATYLPDAEYLGKQIDSLLTTGQVPTAWWEGSR